MSYLNSFVIVFIDDTLIYSCNKNDDEHHLRIALQTLKKRQLYAKSFQCEFRPSFGTFFGNVMTKDDIMVDSKKFEVVRDWAKPTSLIEIQIFFWVWLVTTDDL